MFRGTGLGSPQRGKERRLPLQTSTTFQKLGVQAGSSHWYTTTDHSPTSSLNTLCSYYELPSSMEVDVTSANDSTITSTSTQSTQASLSSARVNGKVRSHLADLSAAQKPSRRLQGRTDPISQQSSTSAKHNQPWLLQADGYVFPTTTAVGQCTLPMSSHVCQQKVPTLYNATSVESLCNTEHRRTHNTYPTVYQIKSTMNPAGTSLLGQHPIQGHPSMHKCLANADAKTDRVELWEEQPCWTCTPLDWASKPHCNPIFYKTKKLWITHNNNVHDKKFSCYEPGCEKPGPFGTSADLSRHKLTHLCADQIIYCDKPHCGGQKAKLNRPDKRSEHENKWHGTFVCSFQDCRRRRIDGIDYGFFTQPLLDKHIQDKHLRTISPRRV